MLKEHLFYSILFYSIEVHLWNTKAFRRLELRREGRTKFSSRLPLVAYISGCYNLDVTRIPKLNSTPHSGMP